MALTLITDSPNQGIYLAGFTIAHPVALIRADSWTSAWEVWCEHLADQGSLRKVEGYDDLNGDNPEGADWVGGHGWVATDDLVVTTVRPSHRD